MNQYLIWSWRKQQWWGSNREGYTDKLESAGRYDAGEAADIAMMGMPGNNTPVPMNLVKLHILADFDAKDIEQVLNHWRRL